MLINTITPSVSVYYGESAQDLALMPTTTTIGQGDYPKALASLGSYAIILESNGLKKYKLRSTGWVEVVESGGGGGGSNVNIFTGTMSEWNALSPAEKAGYTHLFTTDPVNTLEGYGITDAYTKDEVDALISGGYNPYVEYGPTWSDSTATVSKITIPATERLNMISVGDNYTDNIQIQGRNFLEPNDVYISISRGDPYMRHITTDGVTFFWNYDGRLEVSGTYNRSSRPDIYIAQIQMTKQGSMQIRDIFADNTTFVVKAYGLTGNYADVNIGYQKTGNTIEYHPITETFTFKKSDLYFPSATQSPHFYISLPPQQEVNFSCYLQIEEGSTPSGMFMPFFNLFMLGGGPTGANTGRNIEDIIDSRFFVSNMIDITGLVYIWATGEHPNYKVITTTDKNADDITISRIRAVTGVTLGAESGSRFISGTFTTDTSKKANLNIQVLSHMYPKKIYLTYTPNANDLIGDRYISTNRYGSGSTATFIEIPRTDFIIDSPNASSTPMVSVTTTGSASQTFKYRATEYYGDTYTEREMT